MALQSMREGRDFCDSAIWPREGRIRAAVDDAIADGEALRDFRKRFDAAAAKHGWDYKGGAAWRARTIRRTNVAQSYNAGRYRQMKAIAHRRPYWRHCHSIASEDPREERLAWDGSVLRHDDPWRDTHTPMRRRVTPRRESPSRRRRGSRR